MNSECVFVNPLDEELVYVDPGCVSGAPWYVHTYGLTVLGTSSHRNLARDWTDADCLRALDRVAAAVGRTGMPAGERLRADRILASARLAYSGGEPDDMGD